jgi:hypothetical protein
VAERVPVSLLAALVDLVKWLEAAQIPAVVIGGVASSFLGRPRLTQDIGALAIMPESAWETAIETAQNFGITPRIEQTIEFARRSRVLLLKHKESEIDVDVILGGLRFERDAVERGQTHQVSGISVRLPRVEDLMIMKIIAHRAKDLQDVEGLLDAHPGANIEEVRHQVREFASATAMADVLDDFARILKRRRGKRPCPKPRPK